MHVICWTETSCNCIVFLITKKFHLNNTVVEKKIEYLSSIRSTNNNTAARETYAQLSVHNCVWKFADLIESINILHTI